MNLFKSPYSIQNPELVRDKHTTIKEAFHQRHVAFSKSIYVHIRCKAEIDRIVGTEFPERFESRVRGEMVMCDEGAIKNIPIKTNIHLETLKCMQEISANRTLRFPVLIKKEKAMRAKAVHT